MYKSVLQIKLIILSMNFVTGHYEGVSHLNSLLEINKCV